MRILRMLGFSLVLASATASAAPKAKSASLPEGERSQLKQARSRLLVAGSVKSEAGTLVAGPQGAEWQLPGGPRVVARPGSALRVIPQPQNLQLTAGKRPTYTVVFRSGRVDISVPRGSRSAVIVSAPRKVSAIVENGAGSVASNASYVAVANYEGRTIANTGASILAPVKPGSIRVFETDRESVAPLLAPPAEVRGQRLFMTAEAPVVLKSLAWTAPTGAVAYRFELTRSGEDHPFVVRESKQPALGTPVAGLAPGLYRVSIKALDTWGLDSQRGLESTVHVVTASLPKGAYFDTTGAIRVVPGSYIDITPVEGLEMTYSRVSYMPALATLGIKRNQPATIFIRPKGSKEDLPIRFVPRSVRARIEIGPKRASWPKDPITIKVELEDPSGQPVPEWIDMRAKVSVGLAHKKVTFKRVGRTLTASLPAERGAGPWVVRVDVEDQFGYPLGRDFLEIASSRRWR